MSELNLVCKSHHLFFNEWLTLETKQSPVHGPCVSSVQTQALGPAHSGIVTMSPAAKVYPVNTPAVEK